MAVFTVAEADVYFDEFVFDNSAWTSLDDMTKMRALNNAAVVLARRYNNRVIPREAIYEQALWIVKISEARKHAEQGVVSYSIDGISVSLSNIDRSISPTVLNMLGRKVGRTTSGRQGWVLSDDMYINTSMGRDWENER